MNKKSVYEEYDVEEFWLVDPFDLTIDEYVLENQKYPLDKSYLEGETVYSLAFP